VGRTVLTCPVGTSGRVTLTDREGTTALATLAAGVEVEILAWQPYGQGGTRYRVLASKAGVEGWLGAASVKPRELPAPPLNIAPTRAPVAQSQGTRPIVQGKAPASVKGIPLTIGKPAAKQARKRPAAASRDVRKARYS
jgi:hypothetical protein